MITAADLRNRADMIARDAGIPIENVKLDQTDENHPSRGKRHIFRLVLKSGKTEYMPFGSAWRPAESMMSALMILYQITKERRETIDDLRPWLRNYGDRLPNADFALVHNTIQRLEDRMRKLTIGVS